MRALARAVAGILATASLLAAAPPVHAFTVTDAKGKVHRLEDYRGKWVLVNFWATWCPPCLEEIPDLVALSESRRDLVVIGIAMDYRDRGTVLQFADQMFISYPIVFGDQALAARIGKVTGLPTTFLYGPDGRLSASRVGPVTREAIERHIGERTPQKKEREADAR